MPAEMHETKKNRKEADACWEVLKLKERRRRPMPAGMHDTKKNRKEADACWNVLKLKAQKKRPMQRCTWEKVKARRLLFRGWEARARVSKATRKSPKEITFCKREPSLQSHFDQDAGKLPPDLGRSINQTLVNWSMEPCSIDQWSLVQSINGTLFNRSIEPRLIDYWNLVQSINRTSINQTLVKM